MDFFKNIETGLPEKVVTIEKTDADIQRLRFIRLEKIFSQKEFDLKRISIDKPYMNSRQAVDSQYSIYRKMYQDAKNGKFSDEKNKEIITIHEYVDDALSELNYILNDVRKVLESKILNNDADADELLEVANGINLIKSKLTPKVLNKIREDFSI